MDTSLIIAVEMALIVGGLLTFAVWELLAMKRGRDAAVGPSRQPRHPKRQH